MIERSLTEPRLPTRLGGAREPAKRRGMRRGPRCDARRRRRATSNVPPAAGRNDERDGGRLVDARSLRIRPGNGFLEHTLDRNWRSLARPIPKGAVVELSAMRVLVTETTADLRPAEAVFQFDVPLEERIVRVAPMEPWCVRAMGSSAHWSDGMARGEWPARGGA